MTAKKAEAAAPVAFSPSLFAEAVADTAEMTVRHPATNEPTSWAITFAGPGHPQMLALTDRLSRRALQKQRAIEQARLNGKKYKPEVRSVEQARHENIGDIVDQIVSWNGADIAFNRDVAVEMLLDPRYGGLLSQINEFLDDERNFTKRSGMS